MLILTTRWRQRSTWELLSSTHWPLEGSDNARRLRMLPVGQQWRQMWYILSGSTSDSIRLVSHPDTLFRIFGFCRRGSAFINNHAFYCVWSKEQSGNLRQMDFIQYVAPGLNALTETTALGGVFIIVLMFCVFYILKNSLEKRCGARLLLVDASYYGTLIFAFRLHRRERRRC